MQFNELFGGRKPVIGMVHLKALPGSPKYSENLDAIYDFAMRDAEALAEGGVDAIQIENQFDTPYLLEGNIGFETVAFITAASMKLREAFPEIPLGIVTSIVGAPYLLWLLRCKGRELYGS